MNSARSKKFKKLKKNWQNKPNTISFFKHIRSWKPVRKPVGYQRVKETFRGQKTIAVNSQNHRITEW